MAAPLGTHRARLRARLTGESHAQARLDLTGPDGVPDADHRAQIELEAAILSELHDAYGREHHPLDDDVYGMIRVRPVRGALTLHLADGRWENVLDLLLPEPDPDLDVEGLSIAGVLGLRCRTSSKGRIVLHRPGSSAHVTLQLPAGDAAAAAEWIARLARDGDPMRSAPDWTAAERAQLPVYEAWLGDTVARSRVLRRLVAFRHLPSVSLIDDTGQVPSLDDFRQLLGVPAAAERSARGAHTAVVRTLAAPAGRPLVLAVVSGHAQQGQGMGGQGRSSVAAGLARALAAGGRRVLLADADPHGRLEAMLDGSPPEGVDVAKAVADQRVSGQLLRQLTSTGQHDIVILDSGPAEQRIIAESADHWIGVAGLWQQPGQGRLLDDEVVGTDGQQLPAGWDGRWLAAMRANGWDVRWRMVPRDFEGMFRPFPAAACGGVVLLGERTEPGARAEDYLGGLRTGLPVLTPAIPYAEEDREDRTRRDASSAFERIIEVLFG
ncbi:nucleotide-binding protein [Streptomyces sp. RKAG337]|uniref:nucleotide-binding protein n=1 Tax=Streptomyces sp. RKAG337 TaxID=2893404 RepID=UPI002033E1B9|nr:hypothetical protein [Streptomyces sp. RKAG337]MCM2431063.1 hypothetical protein [Streptomyces sp. RKAG337]